MRYVVIRTTNNSRRGVVIEGTTKESILKELDSLFQTKFKVFADKGNEIFVTNGHILVVLKLKKEN